MRLWPVFRPVAAALCNRMERKFQQFLAERFGRSLLFGNCRLAGRKTVSGKAPFTGTSDRVDHDFLPHGRIDLFLYVLFCAVPLFPRFFRDWRVLHL